MFWHRKQRKQPIRELIATAAVRWYYPPKYVSAYNNRNARQRHLHIRLHDVRNNAPLPPRDADDEHVPPNRLWFEKHEARVRHMPYNKNAQH